jgi:aldose 1-epimerase
MRIAVAALLAFTCLVFPAQLAAAQKPAQKVEKPALKAEKTAPTLSKETYGKMPDGTVVEQYTLQSGAGLKVKVITYGAMITSVESPDRDGKTANLCLHRDSLEEYLAGHPMFGCIVGRYGNRIAKARFTIDGVEYRLAANNGQNHIHGGRKSFDKYVWKAEPVEGPGFVGVKMSHTSPDGDEGYPGQVTASLTYTVNDKNELKLTYEAKTTKPTHVNLTNHAYWNLKGAGPGDVLGHELTLHADRVLPFDRDLIPTGPPQSVKGTPLDFTTPKTIGARIAQTNGGYDHCYEINRKPGERLVPAAVVFEPTSGRAMEVSTTQPGVQLYTANGMNMKEKDGAVRYVNHGGFCLETQHYPDSPNHPEFPSTLLRPGETYNEVTVFRFSVKKD